MVDFSRHTSAWQEGADAARAGKESKNCPYPANLYQFVTWHNGWAMARYEMAREQAKQDYEEF